MLSAEIMYGMPTVAINAYVLPRSQSLADCETHCQNAQCAYFDLCP
jgi:hypothetical protein